jgi:hypothetical protein
VSANGNRFPLRVVDGRRLGKEYRDVLRPGTTLCDENGIARQLPRYFYEVPSWDSAQRTYVAPHFQLHEFIHVDVREALPLRHFPRYVPCALPLLGACLELLRDAVDEPVYIAANGGYRSPRHRLTRTASTHAWGTAVNIYRIGDTLLDDQESIARFAAVVKQKVPGAWVRPYGKDIGYADDHLHVDLGYVIATPRETPGELYNPKLDSEPL